ncbi:hypothetical protein H0O03_02170 [Candidatus Micrarchaeota archaeon]|nr:hypothetical protein [Candidatus Micrarchaeota archaeon]
MEAVKRELERMGMTVSVERETPRGKPDVLRVELQHPVEHQHLKTAAEEQGLEIAPTSPGSHSYYFDHPAWSVAVSKSLPEKGWTKFRIDPVGEPPLKAADRQALINLFKTLNRKANEPHLH